MYERISTQFNEHIEAMINSMETLPELLERASAMISESLLQDKKILCAGNGAGAALAEVFVGTMLSQFRRERPSLPAIALNADSSVNSAICNQLSFNEIYSRQVRALGQDGDVFIAFAVDHHNNNLIQGIRAAHDRDMRVLVLTSDDNHDISSLLTAEDLVIPVASIDPATTLQIHMVSVHALCDSIDFQLFGSGE